MKSAARSVIVPPKQGVPIMDKGRPATSSTVGIKLSKSSNSLILDSRLSKLKRASSDDMLAHSGGSTAISSSRIMKKTVTVGAIPELTDSKLKKMTTLSSIPEPSESKMKKSATVGAISEFSESKTRKTVPAGSTAELSEGRMKKTLTVGVTSSEPTEGKMKSSTAAVPSVKRSGIPSPRELAVPVSREKVSLQRPISIKKGPSSPTSSVTPTPTKSVRPLMKLKPEYEPNEKVVLESHVKELLAEAKTKELEISRLRSELKKCKNQGRNSPDSAVFLEQPHSVSVPHSDQAESPIKVLREQNSTYQRELIHLREENQLLKMKLTALEHSLGSELSSFNSPSSPPTQDSSLGSPIKPRNKGKEKLIVAMNGELVHSPGSASSDITKASSSPDGSEFENMDSLSREDSSNSTASAGRFTSREGPQNGKLSLACLTQKIQKMEENHHSTAEELQATIQELTDQQQVVLELTAENEKLTEHKNLLQSSLHQQRERIEQLTQENKNLMLLLQERIKNEEENSKGSRAVELEQKCSELVENSRFEREKLLSIQQHLSSSLRNLEKEHQETQSMLKSLKEENSHLQRLLDSEHEANKVAATRLKEFEVALNELKAENERLATQLETEKQKVVELRAIQCVRGNSELEERLKAVHIEKESLNLSCADLREELVKAASDIKQLQNLLSKVEAECQKLNSICDKQTEDLNRVNQQLQDKNSENDVEIKALKETIFELEDQVEQQRAVQLHRNQTISDLENQLQELEEEKLEMEKRLKFLSKQLKEETEEWKRFQADLQTAVVVANDIKCEAQQELRAAKRKLQEEEERNAKLQKELQQLQNERLSVTVS